MVPQLFSGARGKISYFSHDPKTGQRVDHVLAFVTDISVSVQEGLLPTYVIGQIEPKSIEPLSTDVTCRVGRIVPISATDSKKMLDKNNSLDFSLEYAIDQILQMESVDIAIEDKITGKIIAVVRNARCAGRSTSVSSGDVGRESYNFVGIYDGGYGGDSNVAPTMNYGFEKE